MSKHLNNKQKKKLAKISKRFDIISASSKLEKYRISSSLNISPQKVKILGIQRSEYHPNELNNHKIEELIKKFNYKLEKKFKDINFKKATKVLYAPTHRDHLSLNYKNTLLEKIEGFNLEELNTFLKNENIFLFLREHAEAGLNSHIQNNNLKSNIFNLSAEEFPNLEKYLDFIDVLITDYSGIFIEHLKSKKSFAFALFDIEEYENKRGLILTKEVLFPGFIFRSQKKLIYFLKNREIIDQKYKNQRIYLHSLFFEKTSKGSCERTMQEIYKLML